MAQLRQRLPQADETRDALLTAAQRAAERARDAVNTALEQLPELSLSAAPQALPRAINVPAVRRRRRRGPNWMLIAGVLVGAGAAAYLVFRWLTRTTDEDYGIDEDWPEEPNPGNQNQPPEGDREASLDAEASLEARGVVPPEPAQVGQDVNGSR